MTHLLEALDRQAAERPGQAALIARRGGPGQTLTFAQLATDARRLGAFFHSAGLRPGDHALLFIPVSLDLYRVLTGLWRLGAIPTLVDPSAGADHLAAACAAAPPRAFIAISPAHLLRLRAPALRRIPLAFHLGFPVPASRTIRLPPGAPALDPPGAPAPDDPALLTFTSGSTGRPKGIVRTHRFLLDQHRVLEKSLQLLPGQTDLATLPVFVLANLASGLTTILADANLARPGFIRPDPVLRQCCQFRPDQVTASPAFLQRLLDAPGASSALASLRSLYTGGGPVTVPFLDRLQAALPAAAITAVYGSTEAEPIAEWHLTSAPAGERTGYPGRGLPAGAVDPAIRLAILDLDAPIPASGSPPDVLSARLLPPGRVGEILVSGPLVVRGYLNPGDDHETKIHSGSEVWHRTGDAGWIDPATGRLWLAGRCRAAVRLASGETVFPFQVESLTHADPRLRRSALAPTAAGPRLFLELARPLPGPLRATLLAGLQSALAARGWAQIRPAFLPRIPVDRRHNAKVDYPALARTREK